MAGQAASHAPSPKEHMQRGQALPQRNRCGLPRCRPPNISPPSMSISGPISDQIPAGEGELTLSTWTSGISPLIPLGSVNSKKFERLAGARRLRVGKRDAVVQDRAEVFDCYRGRVSRGRGRDSCHRVHSRVAVGSASRRRRGDPSQHRNSGRNHNADRAAVLFQLGENLPRLGACEARRARSRRNGNAPSP